MLRVLCAVLRADYNELGYDVMEMMMPLIGCNQAYQYGNPRGHQVRYSSPTPTATVTATAAATAQGAVSVRSGALC
jgi:hypothetical protein